MITPAFVWENEVRGIGFEKSVATPSLRNGAEPAVSVTDFHWMETDGEAQQSRRRRRSRRCCYVFYCLSLLEIRRKTAKFSAQKQ